MKTKGIVFSCLLLLLACSKKDKNEPDETISGDIKQVTETSNGITYKIFTNVAYYNSLPYCKGVLAACGASGADQAGKFHNPVFSITCKGNNEGNYAGQALYDQIPANSAVKAKSEGITDNSCNTHCGGHWTDKMYTKMVYWLL